MSEEIEDNLAVMKASLDQLTMVFKDMIPAVASVKNSAIKAGFNNDEAFDISLEALRMITRIVTNK